MKFDIKIYERIPYTEGKVHTRNLEEMETIRGLTETQKITIVAFLERHEIRYLVKRVENG